MSPRICEVCGQTEESETKTDEHDFAMLFVCDSCREDREQG